ncbi:hypothetical protein C0585_03085 [Candidatus Woesearchaeota archaeon]|nr:MAG: hypothetical protein C0585_03085 [Candidatus Woesearchaeota archaeon]
MSWFKKEKGFDNVQKINVFPKIGVVISRFDNKLVVYSPKYLLGKHGGDSQQVSSKFFDLKTAMQLWEVIQKHVSPGKLKGKRVELKEINLGFVCGTDNLVKINKELQGLICQEDVRGHKINVIYTDKNKIPQTKHMNIILMKFDPKYGMGVDEMFKEKYGGLISFDNFEEVYGVVTMYPGSYAPPMDDYGFWKKHALLKER